MKKWAAGAQGMSGGSPNETIASPCATAARGFAGRGWVAKKLAASGPGNTALARASTAAHSSSSSPSPSGVASASTPSSARSRHNFQGKSPADAFTASSVQ
jgi:hypothetical protein